LSEKAALSPAPPGPGWHDYTLASLTPKGASTNKFCPIRLKAGAQVDVIIENDNDTGASVVKVGGKTWWVDGSKIQ
jgi:hypothetical protein